MRIESCARSGSYKMRLDIAGSMTALRAGGFLRRPDLA
jgi:hypothetical protein